MKEATLRKIIREELEAMLPPVPPELLTPKQTAELLSVTVGTLAQWRTGDIGPKYFKAGGIKYEMRDINEYLKAQAI